MARLTPPKSPLVSDKNHSGCMWSLYSLFEFRHGNSRRKLLSDKKSLKREAVDDGYVKQHGLLTNFDEKSQARDDRNENLVDPDMPNDEKVKRVEASSGEKQTSKKTATSEMKLKHSTSELGQLSRNQRKATETCQRPRRDPLHGQTDSVKQKHPSYPLPVAKTLDKLESREALGKKARVKKRRGCGCKNVDFVNYDQLNKINPQLLKVNDVAEAIVNQKFIEGKYLTRDGINQQSKQLLDALDILNSNKELFTKLLQDPNSLLVKHIQDLRDSQAQKQQTKSSSEAKTLDDHHTYNERQHQEHASTSQSEGRSDPQSSETIIVLKPGPTSMQDSADEINHGLEKHVQSVRPTYLSFGNIRRKFRHAMRVTRKEQHLMSIDGVKHQPPSKNQGTEDGNEGKGMEIIRRNFGNIIHVESGEVVESSFDIKKRDKLCKLKEVKASIRHETASSSESGHENSNLLSFGNPMRSESRMYVEGWRHYSELLNNKNEDNNFFQEQVPKILQRTISYPEYEILPLQGPRRDIKTGFLTAQMRFSPYSYSQVAYEKNWRLQKEHRSSYSSLLNQNIDSTTDSKRPNNQFQDVGTKQYISDNLSAHAKVLEVDSSTRGEKNPVEFPSRLDGTKKNATMEATDKRQTEETISSGMLSESDSSDDISTSESSESTNLLELQSESCSTDKTSSNQNTDTTNTNEEKECFECPRLDPTFEDQPSTCSNEVLPSTPSSIGRVEEDPDSIKDRGNQSSPISVLEQLFTDVASPPSTISQPASSLVKSHLDTEININIHPHLYGSISEYVKAVLQDSGLNWDELDLKCRTSDPLLDSCLLDSSKLQSNQFCGDCQLLFDFIGEVLLEVYDTHFRCSFGVSFMRPKNVHSLPMENLMAQEVMKRIDCHFQPHSSAKTLDQLIGKDLRRSETWLDIRNDVEDIVSEVVEDAFEELLMETIDDLHI